MSRIVEKIFQYENSKIILLSLILFIAFYILRLTLLKRIEKNTSLKDYEKLSYIKNVKTYLNLVFLLFIVSVWFSHIQSVFISMMAVAAAIVLATKELIMSFLGGILIRINNYFRLGDRIEIDGYRGFVIDKSLTVTKILEIGPEKHSQQTTGEVIAIPNSLMLAKPVKNESYFKNYSVKSFILPVPEGKKVQELEALI